MSYLLSFLFSALILFSHPIVLNPTTHWAALPIVRDIFAGKPPENLGLHQGHLTECPSSPNCVLSQDADEAHSINPISDQSDRITATRIHCFCRWFIPQGQITTKLGLISWYAVIGGNIDHRRGHHRLNRATYYLIIQQPTVTITLFSLLGWGSYELSKRVREDYQGITVIFARTCLFLVNFGFWVGSLWGDSLWRERDSWALRTGYVIPDYVFVIAWALALLGVGLWAVRRQKRWVVNTLAVFGVIHFYTQYFERLGAQPLSLMIAGIVALVIALVVVRYNRSLVGD